MTDRPTDMALGKRAVACAGWRWLPGMRCTHRWTGGIRVLADESGEQSESYVVLPDGDGNAVMTIDECGIMGGFPEAQSAYPFVPDLADPATLGCLLALVREAWAMPRLWIKWWASAPDMSGADRSFCEVVDRMGRRVACGPRVHHATEAEALVAALEAAP